MVLARFSFPWALISLAGIFFVLYAFGKIYFSHATDIVFWILVPFLPFLILYGWDIFRALVFHGGRAVWIVDGILIFLPYGWPKSLNTFFYSIPLNALDRFSTGSMETGSFVTWLPGIRLHLKSGGYLQIPSYLLEEPRDVILARLNQALAENR